MEQFRYRHFYWPFFFSIISFFWLTITPLPVYGKRYLNELIDFIFTSPTRWIRHNFLPNQPDFDGFYTDSANYVILLFFAFCIALICFFLTSKLPELFRNAIMTLLPSTVIYLLAWVFLIYGFSKLFGHQFPDISTLYIEEISDNKDILFWRWIGEHPIVYQLIGLIEVGVGCGLFFKRTRHWSLLIYIFMTFNILVVNIIFDIGVLIFCLVLLFSSVFAFVTTRKNLISLNHHQLPEHYYKPLKSFLISILFILAYFHNLP